MNANVLRIIEAVYAEVKDLFPTDTSEFEVKAALLDQLRAEAQEQADAQVACLLLTEQVKALAILAQL